jgi:hypothetical protein
MAIGTAAAILGSAALGAATSRSASKTQSRAAAQAADVQKQVADQQTALQREMFERTREDQAPYRTAGYNALAEMQRTAGNVPSAFKFGAGDYQADPGYAFRLAEGQKALDRQAAARGGLISGGALRAAQRYGQEMGSQEYTNAFNRYQTNRANQLNPLQSLMGSGQTAAGQVANAGQNYANQAGQNYMNAGNARASGYVGSANAWSNAIGNAYNQYNQNQMMNQMFPQGGGTAGYTPLPDSQSFDYYNNA